MKCALNDGDLYKVRERYVCVGCVFEKYYSIDLCRNMNLCKFGIILKRNRFQSDIFKI